MLVYIYKCWMNVYVYDVTDISLGERSKCSI